MTPDGAGPRAVEVTLSSPAKVNLFLELVARRTDGYHDIESVMQLVDLCDHVRLRKRARGIRVQVTGAELPAGRRNLAFRAAALLLEEAGVAGGVEINLDKRIPIAGGLGGGSSNAAAVLVGVARLYGLRTDRDVLQKLALRLGSDVPFFLTDGLALARGRGELLTALRPWPPRWLVVANPGVPVSTAWAYQEASSKLTVGAGRVTIQPLITDGRLPWPPVWAFNRLEAVVLPHREEVRALKALLEAEGAAPVFMSGSGASVVGVVPDEPTARAVTEQARARGCFAAGVCTLGANPIFADWA